MDSGKTDVNVLEQQLQQVTLEEKPQAQLDGAPMDIEEPKEMVDNSAVPGVLEAKTNPVIEVEKPKLENELIEANDKKAAPTEVQEIKETPVLEAQPKLPKVDAEKEKYVQAKLSGLNPLKLQPQLMERKAGITAEQKLASLTQAFEAEYAETKDLQEQTKFLIQEAVAQNFKPEKEKPWIWESEESQSRIDREKSKNEARLKHYVETNKEDILLKALKQEIRLGLQDRPEDIQNLDNEEKAQAFVQPIADKRISDTDKELHKLKKDREYARYYAKPPVSPKKDITTDFPGLNAAVGLHFRYPLLQKELDKKEKPKLVSPSEKEQYRKLIEQNQLRSDKASEVNKNVTEGRVLADSVKRFKPVI